MTVIRLKKVQKPNKSIGFEEEVVILNQPCGLSFASVSPSVQSDELARAEQTVKIFCAPEPELPPGCKIYVTRGGRRFEFVQTGAAAVYSGHQEIKARLAV